MAWKECKRKLERIESVHGRQNALRRKINYSIRAGGDVAELSSHLERMYEPVFCEKDYNSGDGFQTAIWGPAAWHYLHITSLNYTKEKKKAYKTLLDGMGQTLPCIHCRSNFKKNVKSAKKSMRAQGFHNVWKNRETYSRFIWTLHHEVNVMLGKCIKDEPSYEQMRDELEMFRSRCLTREEVQKEREKNKKLLAKLKAQNAKAAEKAAKEEVKRKAKLAAKALKKAAVMERTLTASLPSVRKLFK